MVAVFPERDIDIPVPPDNVNDPPPSDSVEVNEVVPEFVSVCSSLELDTSPVLVIFMVVPPEYETLIPVPPVKFRYSPSIMSSTSDPLTHTAQEL